MRRIISLFVITCTVIFFVSCEKEGVYHPSKKINKIITTYPDVYDSYGGISKEVDLWTWGKKNLEKIDYYSNGSFDGSSYFTYDNHNRLARITYDGGSRAEYVYDGEHLKEARCYMNGELSFAYTFSYTNGKITKIDVMEFYDYDLDDDDWKGIKLSSAGSHINVLQSLMNREMAQILNKTTHKHLDKHTGKVELTWDKDNITKIVTKFDDYLGEIVAEAEYDKNNNPFYGSFWECGITNDDVEDVLHSKNNCTKIKITEREGDDYEEADVFTYSYSYEGKYPKSKQTICSMGGYYNMVEEYEYTK